MLDTKNHDEDCQHCGTILSDDELEDGICSDCLEEEETK